MQKEASLKTLAKQEYFLIAIICLLTFILVYSPHFSYKWPMHIDEWHHITEAIHIREGNYSEGWLGTEIGFDIFLAKLSYVLDIVKDYQYFAAIWAVVSALTLFYVVYKKTQDFETSLFAMIFFASIKSNINLLGLWFFTPLTFAIPFIFLYIHFYTEGIEKENTHYLMISMAIMFFLIFIHAISLLFALPFLLIYTAINYKKALKMKKSLVPFLIIPVCGIFFFMSLMNLSFLESISKLLSLMIFNYGWGVSEVNNSFLEVYSLAGYILAILGAAIILMNKETKIKKTYLLWPVCVFAMILLFKISGVSYFSPYQRNMYYFVISLPLLSSISLIWLIKKIENANILKKRKEITKGILVILLIFTLLTLSFISYFTISSGLKPYAVADKGEFAVIEFLKMQEKGTVIAPLSLATALFPVSGQNPLATTYFYGDKKSVEDFFAAKDCQNKSNIIQREKVDYIVEKINETNIECNWTKIYNQGNYTIYRVQ